MKIWVYSIAYNEGPFVKHFLAGYKDAERIIVYDNMSTDDTVELLMQDPRVEVRQFDTNNQIRDDLYLEIKNYSWMEARGKADWVIVVDFDEIFNHCSFNKQGNPVFDLNLSDMDKGGFNIVKPYGYNMISLDAPLYAEGHPYNYSKNATYHVPEEKMCCFKPDEIFEMRYYIGGHSAAPLDRNQGTSGIRIWHQGDYKLMHFKFWNLDTYMKRMAEYQTRLSEWNRKMGAGWHYMESLDYHKNLVINGSKLAVPLFECPHP
jgi:glycosyltransferase involved in cell wall biosynthesis